VSGQVWNELRSRQERIEGALRESLSRYTSDSPPSLVEAMGYSLFAPGKRLRPLLCALACEAAGGTLERSLPAGCAVEMVHTYSLVHDDLPAMDDDDLRRGLPTCHVQFGEALAILAGDALLTLAFEVIGSGYGPRTVAVSTVELAVGAGPAGMVGGQTLDLEAEGRITGVRSQETGDRGLETESQGSRPLTDSCPLSPVSSLESIHRRKTGALFRAALRLGLYAAQAERDDGVNLSDLAAIDDYAAAFGLLFQITDDLLDVESTPDKTGKRVNKDAGRGKLTYPGLLGVEESRRRAEELGRRAVDAAERLNSELLAKLARSVVERDR